MNSSPFELADNNVRATRMTRLGAEYEHDLHIQRSLFRARLVPVRTEAEARDVIEEERKKYHDARHHCSAFILGADRETQRSSDDGEPAGTAGVPMLTALAQRETSAGAKDLADVVAVVTRWFGGILLGAGGLVRAYSDAVSQALDRAQLQSWWRRREVVVGLDMALAGKAENVVRGMGLPLMDVAYTAEGCAVTVAVEDAPEELMAAEGALLTAFSGDATLTRGQMVWSR